MLILGIETSCDDTGISLIEFKSKNSNLKDFEIISNIVSSQVKLHAKYGGVYPFLAKREHKKNLPIVFKKATKGTNLSKIDLMGVTVGPGLEPCLWEGVNFAKNLAEKLKIPIVPVNHLEAHILTNFIGKNSKFKIQNSKFFPAVCLVVSGGHTVLVLMEKIGKYKLIGETRDDAAGECFDKAARILGFGYPGGPAIAREAAKLKTKNYELITKLPRPMIYQKNYDFSFSGLKTAVFYDFKSRPKRERESKEYKIEMAKEVQRAIVEVLVSKTLRAAREFKVKSVILGGGVAANDELRREFNFQLKNLSLEFFAPPKIFCTDNGAMVAFTAYFHRKKAKKNYQEIKAEANLKL